MSPWNGWRPVNISYTTTPKEKTSLRWSAGNPFACSGDMYAAVPRMMPAWLAIMLSVGESDMLLAVRSFSIAFARPKSSTFTLSSGVILTFAGLRSRWTMPRSCAASSASVICCAILSVSSTGSGPRRSRSASVSPSMSSITRKWRPSATSMP